MIRAERKVGERGRGEPQENAEKERVVEGQFLEAKGEKAGLTDLAVGLVHMRMSRDHGRHRSRRGTE